MKNKELKKSLNTELKQCTYVVLEPNVVDGHGDIYNEDEIRKAKESFNDNCMRANIMHKHQNTSSFRIIESYCTPADMVINGEAVLKGSWLTTLQINDDDVWESVKSGVFNGVSIACVATVEHLDQE